MRSLGLVATAAHDSVCVEVDGKCTVTNQLYFNLKKVSLKGKLMTIKKNIMLYHSIPAGGENEAISLVLSYPFVVLRSGPRVS